MRHLHVRHAGKLAALGVLAAASLWAGAAQASEAGTSFYLLGAGGPGAALMPPLQGVFFHNIAYFYSGTAGREKQFEVGGNVVAGLKASVPADFPTLLWVPSTDVLGGTLGLGTVLPLGEPNIHADAVISGPRGRQIGVSAQDDHFIVGDPVLIGNLGWKDGRGALQLATQVNVPVGDFREGKLANIAFHRWAGDVSLAATWRDPETGWDVSGKAGVTFNGRNGATDYTTGTESHYEASVEKAFSPTWSAGLQGYYFHQLTGDTGPGALLGSFKGRVAAVGATAALNVKAGIVPLIFRVRALHEFDAKNRPQGDSLWLELSLPLHVKLPPGANRP